MCHGLKHKRYSVRQNVCFPMDIKIIVKSGGRLASISFEPTVMITERVAFVEQARFSPITNYPEVGIVSNSVDGHL